MKNYREFILENSDNKEFLGYHSSYYKYDGYNKCEVLDEDKYSDVIRNIYIEYFFDDDENAQNSDISGMNEYFEEQGYGFTFVSEEPIMASNFQASKYKYGDTLYKVYGNGDEILVDDVNEIGATIVLTKNPLYFEEVEG